MFCKEKDLSDIKTKEASWLAMSSNLITVKLGLHREQFTLLVCSLCFVIVFVFVFESTHSGTIVKTWSAPGAVYSAGVRGIGKVRPQAPVRTR